MSVGNAAASLTLQAGGTLNPRRHVYIERPEDAELLRLLLAGEYVNVVNSRQMGKSSLMAKTMEILRQRHVRAASIDLAADLAGADDVESWFRGLISRLARELRLDVDVARWWGAWPSDAIGQRLQRFMRDVVGAQISGPIVIFADEIESTLKHGFTDAFFTAIRGMYNERSQEPAYERITFCLLGVATPNELIKDRRTTAYNVGQTLELRDFDPERDDLRLLAGQLHGDAGTAQAMLARILYWTGGQPFLTVNLCAALRTAEATSAGAVDGFVEQAFTTLNSVSNQVHFQQILRFVETRLSQDLESLDTYGRVLKGERIREQTTPAHLALKLSGLVRRDSEGCLVVRNRVYQRLFDARWLAATRPQRKLSRYRTLTFASGVMLALLMMFSLYIGYDYVQQRQLARALEKLGGQGIRVAGNMDNGFQWTLPESTTQQMLDNALAGFPYPEKIRSLGYRKDGQSPSPMSRESPAPIDNLAALRRLTALQALDLSGTRVKSIAPLEGLANLQKLNLSGTLVTSVEPLEGLTALQELVLSRTLVHSVEPLRGLTALRELDLSGTRVSNVAALEGLTALQSLDLAVTLVRSLEPLKDLTALKELYLSYAPVSSVEPLERLTALLNLDLARTQVSSVEALKDLKALQELDLSNTNVTSLAALYGLPNLRSVNIDGTDIPAAEAARFNDRARQGRSPTP